jgi:acyl-CoA thioester hydrolase
VRYADTDQMGVVYYGHYAQYFEVGRVEALRALGMSYAAMEKAGYVLPVTAMEVKYLRPARYDDHLRIQTSIDSYPDAYRIGFVHRIFNEEGQLLTKAKVSLYILDRDFQKITLPPCLLDALKPYFESMSHD